LSRHTLALRFLTRMQIDVAQLRASLPNDPLMLEPLVANQLERIAHKISNETEAFGFPEISAIAAAIELLSTDSGGGTVRQRFELRARLNEQIAALESYLKNELEETRALEAATSGPMSAHLPGSSARFK
jgi:HPt (histidine-containing phosphotransfer) domain-containing protein